MNIHINRYFKYTVNYKSKSLVLFYFYTRPFNFWFFSTRRSVVKCSPIFRRNCIYVNKLEICFYNNNSS